MENPPKERETRRYRAHHRTALGGKGHCSKKEEALWACQPALSSAGSESPGACYPPGPAPSLQSRPFNYRRVRDGVARVMEPAAVLPPRDPQPWGRRLRSLSTSSPHPHGPQPRVGAARAGCGVGVPRGRASRHGTDTESAPAPEHPPPGERSPPAPN